MPTLRNDTVKHWKSHLQTRHSSVQYETRSSKLSTANDASNVARVSVVELSDKGITIKEIIAELGLHHGTTL